MTPSEFERLRSWAIEIAETLLLPETRFRDEGDERRFPGHAGLQVNRASGLWFSHSKGRGGTALGLIEFLRSCSRTAAVEWAEAWLASHEGFGSCGTGDRDGHPGSAAPARDVLDQAIDVSGTTAEAYLRAR